MSWADLRPPLTREERWPRSAMLDDNSFDCIISILLRQYDTSRKAPGPEAISTRRRWKLGPTEGKPLGRMGRLRLKGLLRS